MKVRNLLRLPVKEDREQNTPLLCLPRTYLGLEYEWENTEKFPYTGILPNPTSNEIANAVKGYFAHHTDGSLREGGMEFTFKEAYCGTRALAAVDAMDACARAFNFSFSYRTSLHVHMDLSELSYPADTHRFAALYSLVEPLLYKFIGAGRDGCNYCIPWFANPHHYTTYARIVKPYTHKGNIKAGLTDGCLMLGAELLSHKPQHKYSGLNLMSLGQFGTAEFRQAPVNMQKEKILLWLNILMRMKKYVLENQWESEGLLQKVKALGPTQFILNVFNSEAIYLLRSTRDVGEDLKKGSLTLFHFTSAVQ